MTINSNEREIRGRWHVVAGRVTADESARRIEVLVAEYLKESGRDATGWDILYVDPNDGRFWELTYPQADTHGGGPPLLKHLTDRQTREKYSHLF
jgi:hypothetical protein